MERFVAEIDTRRGHDVFHQVVFIHAYADEDAGVFGLPFVLHVTAHEMHVLRHVAAVTENDVVQAVVFVFHAGREFGGHEPEAVEGIGVLAARDGRHV